MARGQKDIGNFVYCDVYEHPTVMSTNGIPGKYEFIKYLVKIPEDMFNKTSRTKVKWANKELRKAFGIYAFYDLDYDGTLAPLRGNVHGETTLDHVSMTYIEEQHVRYLCVSPNEVDKRLDQLRGHLKKLPTMDLIPIRAAHPNLEGMIDSILKGVS